MAPGRGEDGCLEGEEWKRRRLLLCGKAPFRGATAGSKGRLLAVFSRRVRSGQAPPPSRAGGPRWAPAGTDLRERRHSAGSALH